MPAPPPHDGPCKRCESSVDVTALGRYRGLCAECRPLVAAEQQAERDARGDGNGGEAPERERAGGPGKKQPKLKDACLYLAKKADGLDKALEKRKVANREAQAALRTFKEQLSLVGRVAQSLINQSAPSASADEE